MTLLLFMLLEERKRREEEERKRREQYSSRKYSDQEIKCKKCLDYIVSNGLLPRNSRNYRLNESEKKMLSSNFRRWSLRNHPDKGGDVERYKTMNACIDMIAKENKCNFYSYF